MKDNERAAVIRVNIDNNHLIVKVRIKTVSREATTKSFNVTQLCLAPEISDCTSVCQYLLLFASSINEVEFSTDVKVTSSSLIVKSTVEGRSDVTGAVLRVKVVVGVVWDAQ